MKDQFREYLKPNSKNIALIYILYLCSAVVPFLSFVGILLLYLNKNYYDDFCRSHYIFLLRTFVLGVGATLFSIIVPIILVSPLLRFSVSIWFLCRVAFGFKYLAKNKEHPNPLTLWIN
ncbi:MAG: hypothetical protein ACRYE9_02420 [Janthinobacterium lividum]